MPGYNSLFSLSFLSLPFPYFFICGLIGIFTKINFFKKFETKETEKFEEKTKYTIVVQDEKDDIKNTDKNYTKSDGYINIFLDSETFKFTWEKNVSFKLLLDNLKETIFKTSKIVFEDFQFFADGNSVVLKNDELFSGNYVNITAIKLKKNDLKKKEEKTIKLEETIKKAEEELKEEMKEESGVFLCNEEKEETTNNSSNLLSSALLSVPIRKANAVKARKNKMSYMPPSNVSGSSQIRFIEMMKANKNFDNKNKGKSSFTKQDVSTHQSPIDMWVILNGEIYDITSYLDFHPGGRTILQSVAGKDITKKFNEYHPWVNYKLILESCYIGRCVKNTN